MLNIGMTEILVFGIIALLILGPEKLTEAVRFIAKWYHRVKRTISNVQQDLDRELRISELQIQMHAEMQKIQELELKMQNQLNELHQQNTVQQLENVNTTSLNKPLIRYQFIHKQNICIFNPSYKTCQLHSSKLVVSQHFDQYKVAV